MFSLLFDFYYNLFYMGYAETEYSNILDNILGGNSLGLKYGDDVVLFFDDFGQYLALICSIISLIVILLICCLLIKKIYNMCAHIIG